MKEAAREEAIEQFKSRYPRVIRDAVYSPQLIDAFKEGYDAGAASVDRVEVVREAFEKLEDYTDGVSGIPFETNERFQSAMDQVLAEYKGC